MTRRSGKYAKGTQVANLQGLRKDISFFIPPPFFSKMRDFKNADKKYRSLFKSKILADGSWGNPMS